MNKVFQIGFNKCGTISIYHFFKNNGLNPIHWDGGRLSETIKKNYENNLPLLTNYESYDCFTDMENVGKNIFIHLTHYKELDRQYPNSKFILNIRPIENWIKSRLNHPNYLNYHKKITGLEGSNVITLWKNQWYEHINSVKDYFKDRSSDLLIFDIESESHKLLEFFSKYIEIKTPEFGHYNKTKKL